ncbi:hypothetical protein ACWEPM_13870 [Streptomyces sp. NPDC004244]
MLKTLGRSTAALLCVLMLASCDSGDSEVNTEHPCGIAPSSEEEVLLQGILRAEGFETEIRNLTSRVAAKLEGQLREMGPERETLPRYTCSYWPGGQKGRERVTFGFGWVPRASKDAERPLAKGVLFEVNGALGQANDTYTRLHVQCDMPGELGEKSKSAWLYANASYTVNIARTDLDQAARDRQTVLTYLMTRRVTDALGCENKPLEKSPVVKPLPTP